MRSRLALLVAPLALLLARDALASPSARLVYSRTPEAAACPDEPALRKAVAARVGYDPFFPWAKQTVVVQIGLQRGALGARVEIVDEDGVARGVRELTSAQGDCVELFDATALAISIALDAAATAEPPAAITSSASAEPPTPTPPVTQAPPVILPPRSEPRDSASAPPPPRPTSFFAGVDALASVNMAPSVAAGAAVFAGARVRFLSAAFEMRIDAPASTTIAGGSVTSWLYAGSVVPCAHYGVGSLCAVGMLGALKGTSDAREAFTKSALFAAVGGRLGGEWVLTRTLSLRAHADVLRDLAPPSLRIDAVAWTAPSVAAFAGVGLVAHFP